MAGRFFLKSYGMKSKMESLFNVMSRAAAVMSENTDPRRKEVGDRVIVWDGSANRDVVSGHRRHGNDPLFQNEAIVIEAGCTELDYFMENVAFVMDILLQFPTGERVYTCSRFVKRVDNYNE